MIPKIIHLVDITGDGLPIHATKYIASIMRTNPDYRVKVWTNETLPVEVTNNKYYLFARESGKLAFASDVARTWILLHYGGYYLDNDVELKSHLINSNNYSLIIGYENKYILSTATIGVRPMHPVIQKVWERYSEYSSLRKDNFLQIPNVEYFSIAIKEYGVKLNGKTTQFKGVLLLSRKYLSPLNYFDKEDNLEDKHTVAIHHFNGSWTKKMAVKSVVIKYLAKLSHDKVFLWMRSIHRITRKY